MPPHHEYTTPAKCSTCDRPMGSPVFCDSCRSLYPADGLNHFELLGLAPTFELDPAALRQRYLQISRAVHPDYHGESTESGVSLRVSAQLNEAHRVLADPVLRAEYLLELMGGPSAREDKGVPTDVLSDTLELREEIAEAKATGSGETLAACQMRVRGSYDSVLARIVTLARGLPGDATLRRELRAALNSMKYYQRLLAEL